MKKLASKRRKPRSISAMGKLVQSSAWMTPEEKKAFVDALKKHAFLDGQSDFFKKCADALVSQSKNGKPAIAQPLCFLNVEERANLERYKALREVMDRQ